MEKIKIGTFIIVKMKVVSIIEDVKGFHYKSQLLDAKPYDVPFEVNEYDIEEVVK
jgi:hypothetical protein